ncbi:MAG: FAD-dependent monooxygenase [Hyphomicrobiaceae bacterium]
MSDPRPILIAGGGISGLAAALALAATGRSSRILERRVTFSESGAGIQLSPNAVHVLRHLGLADRLAPHVGTPAAIVVRDGATGSVLQRLPLDPWLEARHGAPYWVAHRRDLQAALLAACRDHPLIDIVTSFDVDRVVETAAGIEAVGIDGARQTGVLLIGADGLHSRLRTIVAPGQAAIFSGRTAARTVIPAGAAPSGLEPDSSGVWLATGAHVVHYPVRAGSEIAVVVIRQESWQPAAGAGWSEPVAADAIAASLNGFASAITTFLAQGRDWRRWALFDAPPLPRWSASGLTLIGDAAHPALPFLAQGGAMGLEDAVSLAAALVRHGDIATALRAHEVARRPRTARVATAARRNGRIFHLGGLAARARNVTLRNISGERVMASYDWLYGWRPPS